MKKSVGFRISAHQWYKFKAKCYEEGYKVGDVLTAMIKLFITNEEFRKTVIAEMSGD